MLLNINNIMIFKFSIEVFLFMNDRIRERYIKGMHDKIIIKMMTVEKIGLSRSTKILHTLYPEIMPMIDNLLQDEYKRCCKKKNSNYFKNVSATDETLNIFNAYYKSLKDNWYNLARIKKRFDNYVPCLTIIRIFDILWWSYLKSKNLEKQEGIKWTTIKSI